MEILCGISFSQNVSIASVPVTGQSNFRRQSGLVDCHLVQVPGDLHCTTFPTGHRVKNKEGEPEGKHFIHILLLVQLHGRPSEQRP